MGRHLLSADWSPEMRATLGQRFLRRMKELNLQAKDVVDRFNDLRERKLPPHLLPVIRQLEMGNGRSRVSRIAHGQPIELFQEEAELWAGALDWSLEQWLQTYEDRGHDWEPERLAKFAPILATHEARAKEIVGYSAFIPCSLEPPEFMRLHHRYLCERDPRYQGAVIHHGSVERAIQHYNDFGDRRRQRLEERLRSSKPELLQLQLCYAKDLEDIAKGVGIYSDIPPTVRRECLEHLRDLLCHHPRRVQLFISANDPEGRNSLRYRLFGMDSLVVVGRSFVFWRHFNLAMNFDTEPEKIDSYGGLLDEFRKSAKHQGQLQTIQFLNGLINSLSGRTR